MVEKVKASELGKLRMVVGNENKYSKVIDLDSMGNGQVLQWVGIGWIEIGDAKKEDYEKYPVIER